MNLVPHADPGTTAVPAWCELPFTFEPREFRIQWASGPWMQAQALALRRQVFCDEQRLFQGDDLDDIDLREPSTQLLVALSCWGGQPAEVVGTVRIHEEARGRWWGSRLAVRHDWRRHGALGSTLIRLAVSSAHALGCTEFLAHVQAQNVPLFRRLRWQVLDEVALHGRTHARMRADLAHYPPCDTPYAGFVLAQAARGGRHD
ncbi:MSMEG_0567/Sll0786 family nitrogen starvation N-acetyltransferase [Azohydromonas lata]|uniref:MSMEG_0567/Sll0786 family nitrogen starvation N-acetyltransferase n=1 Tax=Azohydromonas lata TaxID=45677 RepID=A0ABU5IH85_9BURK|nr:MSMEG_0567/Sll0786 family nitrogen starvation N-acetyltransferase [Azohydromonas lata]MDZ5458501.1 MSMEG_0567/Sll0786 family nitrogen starvation N-acetyltransferase [Azohydromonas lata]